MLKIQTLPSCDSTNDLLKQLAREEGFLAPLALIAHEQTAGRGRLGHQWASPLGGAYFSLATELATPAPQLTTLPLIVALAVREALAKFTPSIGIKWPNDILALNQQGDVSGKISGILIETLDRLSDPRLAIIGVGINVQRSSKHTENAAQHSLPPAPVYLSDLTDTREITPIAVAEHTLSVIEDYLRQWADAEYQLEPFASTYLSYLLILNKQIVLHNVRASLGSLPIQGTVSGINQRGELLLTTADGQTQAFSSNEVTLSPPRLK